MNSAVATLEPPPAVAAEPRYAYSLYGLHLRSPIPLTLPEAAGPGPANIELHLAAPDWFAKVISHVTLDSSDWIHHHELAGGWSYIRYDEMFDFLVAPAGDRIFYRLLGPFSVEAFQTYALGRVFSFALVKMGHEPLHAATLVVNGQAVAFLGASTFGKSSLAACFVAANYRLLTDDVLRLKEHDGGFLACPGSPRLKLFPEVARLFLGDRARGLQMNAKSAKFVYPLSSAQSYSAEVPLAAIYALTAPRDVHRRQRIRIESPTPREALLKVLAHTHNDQLTERDRLERQFSAARRLLDLVPVRKLSYPRVLSSLPEVRDAVITDLQRSHQW